MPVISRSTRDRDEGYFRLEWKLAIDRCHLMAADRTSLVPVVIDDTPDDDDRVPDRFKEVQWTRLPGGKTTPAFVERVRHMLSADGPGSPAPGRPSLDAPLSVDPAPKQQPMKFSGASVTQTSRAGFHSTARRSEVPGAHGKTLRWPETNGRTLKRSPPARAAAGALSASKA
jgi:hypothetical protein